MDFFHWILQGIVRGIAQYLTVKFLERKRTTLRPQMLEWFKIKKH